MLSPQPLLRGRLDFLPLADVLAFLQDQRGSLAIAAREAGSGHFAWLAVDGGRIVHARSSHPAMRLGQVLVDRGLLSNRDRIELLKSRRGPLGQAAVDRGYVDREILHRLLPLQMRLVVFHVLDWRAGSFRIYRLGRHVPAGDAPSIAKTLLEHGLRKDEWARIERLLPGEDVALEPLAATPTGEPLVDAVAVAMGTRATRSELRRSFLADPFDIDRAVGLLLARGSVRLAVS
ncbi:MAG: DUF4388 domain-containing protein [Acidobacteriota bacterium]